MITSAALLRLGAVICGAAMAVTACGTPATSSNATSPSPSTASETGAYVALVKGFWHDHVIATSGALEVCVDSVNPPLCKVRGDAMLAVQQKFEDDLARIQAPAKFATEDRTIRLDLPVTVADLRAMVAASSAGDKPTVQTNAAKYVSDMQPILEAFDRIDPAVQHV